MGAAFLVPLALSAVSAGAQYANQQSANSRAQGVEAQNIEEQEAMQQKANSQVNALTKQITQSSPQTLADQLTGGLVNTLRQNAAGSMAGGGATSTSPINFGASTSALPSTSSIGSQRYKSDAANAQSQLESYGNQEANLMGNIGAPTLERQQQGLAMQSLGANLNLLGAQSATQNNLNQIRAQAAGVQDPWLSLLSGTTGGAASTLSKNWGSSVPSTSAFSSPYFDAASNQLTGAGAGSLLDNL